MGMERSQVEAQVQEIPQLSCPALSKWTERKIGDQRQRKGETSSGGRVGKLGGGLTLVEDGPWASQLKVASVVDHTIQAAE